MMRRFYTRFIQPLSKDADQAAREAVLNYLLVGIASLTIVAGIVSVIGPFVSHLSWHPDRLLAIGATLVFVSSLYCMARYLRRYRLVAVILTVLVALLGCAVAAEWGIWDPYGVLLFSLAVVMAGILVGSRYSLYLIVAIAAVLLYLQNGQSDGNLHPDRSWLTTQPVLGDAIAMSAMLLAVALVSWLFNRQMEASLRRAQHSERALQQQKKLLEVKAEKRAQQLEAAQLDKMQELYRFAELGRLSTALFHDLANHLSTVSLDIEGLSGSDQSAITQRISQNIGHIDNIVQRVRQQIRGKNNIEVFKVLAEIDEVLKILRPMADQAGVKLKPKVPAAIKPGLSYTGDIVRFRQIVMNLVSNGIEAYTSESTAKERVVTIELERRRSVLSMTVSDTGIGILPANRDKIFRPFYTTKQGGTGIGLFIVQQVVEHDFGGQLELVEDPARTVFQVSLPKSYYGKG